MKNKFLGPNNKLSENIRIAVLLAGLILLIINLFLLDYEQLFSSTNVAPGLNMLANLFLIAGMSISLRHTRKQK